MQTVEPIPPPPVAEPNTQPWVPEWQRSKTDVVRDVEFRGFKFKAVWCSGAGIVVFGDEEDPPVQTKDTYYGIRWKGAWAHQSAAYPGADQSCAYARYKPILCQYDGSTGLSSNAKYCTKPWVAASYAWVLSNTVFSKGTTCYVTYLDGQPTILVPSLKARGFKHVATNKSGHGAYKVYMLVHPGDNNINKEPEDAIEFKVT